jgi:hypothetical protein
MNRKKNKCINCGCSLSGQWHDLGWCSYCYVNIFMENFKKDIVDLY